ncbi:hypothetical protein niasHT_029473 [Heterodera trifolii]|uniref:Uncharacterized protein n=1 Tax=Heterodera trifolii TaxID=157864 RepID=A0ABD2KIB1_9BILA
MEFFFFDPIKFGRFYNCSSYDVSMVPLDRRQKPLVGALTIALGTILTCLYLPCLFALSRPKLIRQPCYQLMFFLGLVNVTELCAAAICAGAFAIFGTVFCSQPTFMFWHGVLGTGLFFTELMTSCSLALNRLLNFYNVLLAERFFGGLKMLFWILLFFALTFWVSFWDPPHIYNPILNSFIQIPHYGYIELDTESEAFLFPLWPRYFSVAILCLTTLIYSAFLAIYISKRKQVITIGMDKKDKSVFVQVLWLSLLSFSVNLAYTFDREASNLSFGQFIVPFYTYGFILYQGSPPVIYLLLNKTIRRELNLDNTPTVHPIGITNVKPFPISVNVSKNGMMIPVK